MTNMEDTIRTIQATLCLMNASEPSLSMAHTLSVLGGKATSAGFKLKRSLGNSSRTITPPSRPIMTKDQRYSRWIKLIINEFRTILDLIDIVDDHKKVGLMMHLGGRLLNEGLKLRRHLETYPSQVIVDVADKSLEASFPSFGKPFDWSTNLPEPVIGFSAHGGFIRLSKPLTKGLTFTVKSTSSTTIVTLIPEVCDELPQEVVLSDSWNNPIRSGNRQRRAVRVFGSGIFELTEPSWITISPGSISDLPNISYRCVVVDAAQIQPGQYDAIIAIKKTDGLQKYRIPITVE